MPLTSTYCNALINCNTVIYYNYGKNRYFISFYLELKKYIYIKEIEEEEIFNKLGKEEL